MEALFASASVRTAGFNTVDLGRFSEGTKLFHLFFMLVGGSPGSTAGGIKTTTLAVLVLGCFYDPGQASYSLSDVAEVATTRDVARVFALEVPGYAAEVLTSFLPIAGVFVVFQLISRRYRARQIRQILVGFLYTYVGLVLFLCGVNVGFSPVGAALGQALAASAWR